LNDLFSTINTIIKEKRQIQRYRLANAYELIADYENYTWFRYALRAIDYCLNNKEIIGADDVWEALENYSQPNSPASMGLVFKIASKTKMIEPTGEYRKTRRKKANGRPIRTWRRYNDDE
jgi:hypothetical protein